MFSNWNLKLKTGRKLFKHEITYLHTYNSFSQASLPAAGKLFTEYGGKLKTAVTSFLLTIQLTTVEFFAVNERLKLNIL